MTHKPTREEAWTILTDHVKSPSLLSHALAVEAVMRHVARKKGADEERWGVIGLIHDVDYEEHPDEHLRHAPEILRAPWVVRGVHTGGRVPRMGIIDGRRAGHRPGEDPVRDRRTDGLVAAAALVRPSRSVLDLPVKSVLKKWKDKAFAAGVDRKVIEKGAALMGVPLEELIADTIEGMKTVAETIGLKGNPT